MTETVPSPAAPRAADRAPAAAVSAHLLGISDLEPRRHRALPRHRRHRSPARSTAR
jgi:hypothetical protein